MPLSPLSQAFSENICPWQVPRVVQHSQRLCESFRHWTGRSLLPDCSPEATPEALAEALFHAPFVVVSHGTQADPIFNYGNQTALDLWQMDWAELMQMPSRYTAAPDARSQRAEFLERLRTEGFLADYSGIRIAKTGQRFWIQDVVLWTVLAEGGDRIGQAASFDTWKFIADSEP